MRVGIMLRTIEEDHGIGMYTRYLIPRLLRLDPDVDYVLIYRSERHRGAFSHFDNVVEVVLRMPTKPLWDQVGVPWLARKFDLDLVFNTKFTLPLLTGRHSVMTLHGSDWFTHPEHYHSADVHYIRQFMPRYCRKADHLIANSEFTAKDFVRLLGVPRSKITTIHLAAADYFKPVTGQEEIARVRRKYDLPSSFVLSVGKYSRQKNVGALIQAYGRLPPAVRSRLVLVGPGLDRYPIELGLGGSEIEAEIVTPGWIEQADLPAVYSMADLFVFPSIYEGFGIPVLEAMSCGCPIVASNTGALPEITDGAASLIDPQDLDQLARAIQELLERSELRHDLSRRGLERAADFGWEKHAVKTLEVLQRVNGEA